MVDNECVKLVDEYIEWLRNNMSIVELEDACEITTPFLDRHNDHLQIYVQEIDGQYLLSDDGYIINDLMMSGLDLGTDNRQNILKTILAGFGVNQVDDVLQIKAQSRTLAQRKHNLIQAMLAVNDMFVTARPYVFSMFREDVEQYLRAHQVRFISSVSFIGRSGFTHTFDFAIPPSQDRPERLVKAINNPSKDNVSSLIFSWNDTREVREDDAIVYAMLNDQDRSVSLDALSALDEYKIHPIQWSNKEQYVEELAR